MGRLLRCACIRLDIFEGQYPTKEGKRLKLPTLTSRVVAFKVLALAVMALGVVALRLLTWTINRSIASVSTVSRNIFAFSADFTISEALQGRTLRQADLARYPNSAEHKRVKKAKVYYSTNECIESAAEELNWVTAENYGEAGKVMNKFRNALNPEDHFKDCFTIV